MKFNIIYSDFPWKYNSRANHKTRFRGGAEGHYPLMTMDEIRAVDLPSIMAPNCVHLMWTTYPYLIDQIKLFEHWGLTYRTLGFNWNKINPKCTEAFAEFRKKRFQVDEGNFVDFMIDLMNMMNFFGVGYYAKSNTEICLLGTRGKVNIESNGVSSNVFAVRKEHSRKPDEIRNRIVSLFGDYPRVELFARYPADGWEQVGNGLDGLDINESIKKMALRKDKVNEAKILTFGSEKPPRDTLRDVDPYGKPIHKGPTQLAFI